MGEQHRAAEAHDLSAQAIDISAMSSKYRFPGIVLRVLREIDSRNSTFESLARVIEADPDLTVRLMKVGNSAFYAARYDQREHAASAATNVRSAIRKIGFGGTKSIALAYGLCDMADCQRGLGLPILRHLLIVAELSRALGRHHGGTFSEDAYLGGLFHDIGKLMMLRALGKEYERIAEHCQHNGLTAIEGEQEFFSAQWPQGIDHRQVGVELLRRNNFPGAAIEALEHHHDAIDLRCAAQGWQQRIPDTLPLLIQVANHIAYHLGYPDGISGRNPYPVPAQELFALMGLDESTGQGLARDAVDRASAVMKDANIGTSARLLSEIEVMRRKLQSEGRRNRKIPRRAAKYFEVCRTIVALLRSRAAVGIYDFVAHTGCDEDQLKVLLTPLMAQHYVQEIRAGQPGAVFQAGHALHSADVHPIIDTMVATVMDLAWVE